MNRLKKKKASKPYFKKAKMPVLSFFKEPMSLEGCSYKSEKHGIKLFLNRFFFFVFLFLLPTQLGKHWFFSFSYLSGVRSDYLAPTLYLTDVVIIFLAVINYKTIFNFLKQKKLFLSSLSS